jgi:hypothetical protein
MRDYRERLYVPLAYWLLAIPTVLILGATLYAGLPSPWPIVVLAAFASVCVAMFASLGWATVTLDEQSLRAGNVVVPLDAVSEVITLDERQSTRLRGPRADPAAILYSRPYLKQSVYLAVDDAAQQAPGRPGVSGVPYYLLGTRHPAELAAAIDGRRVRGGQEPVA